MANKNTLKRRRNRMNKKNNCYNKYVVLRKTVDEWEDLPCPKLLPMQLTTNTQLDSLGYCYDIPPQEQKEPEMNYVSASAVQVAANPEKEQRYYLSTRLSDITYFKAKNLLVKYGLRGEDSPRNAYETVARIKAGMYVIDEEIDSEEGLCLQSPLYGLEWRDPAIKKDREGYEKARDQLDKDRKAVQDIIQIKSLDEGLTAVQEFEKATLH